MPYRPSSQIFEKTLGPIAGAILPASLIASAIGTLALLLLLLSEAGGFSGDLPSLLEALLFALVAAVGLGFVVVFGVFVVAFYLAIFGVPVAILLGPRIGHPLALAISLLDAALAAGFAVTGSMFQGSGEPGFPLVGFAIALCYALPAGYFYRRNVIAMREEWSILND